jgi:sugar phosphate isomerase/epimerase
MKISITRYVSILAAWMICGVLMADGSGRPAGSFSPSFYAFQNGVGFGSPDDDAQMLKELGFDGVSQVMDKGVGLSTRVAAYEKVGLKVLSVYLNVNNKPIPADMVRPLKNRGALIELTVRKMTPQTVEAARQTAEMAAALNIRVALYPHFGFGIATMPQAMELIARVDHPNLGVMFNLCHFLKSEKAEDLEKVLHAAGSRLFAVSTAGADLDGKSWDALIKTLDQGDFPQERLLKALEQLNYKGPVGLQCYGVTGDLQTNLRNSMVAWKQTINEL